MANRRSTISNFKLAGVAAAMMITSADLSALGLGALEVQSNLDQPLNGFIELRVAAGDDISSVKADIATREDFDNLGIDYPEYLQDITLDIEDVNGATVLRVNSRDVIIKEPFIHFLVRVEWSGGSFLREYTALIDPPVYAAETPKTVAEPVAVGTDESYQTDSFDDISVESLDEEADVVDEVEEVDEVLTDAAEDALPEEETITDDNFYQPEAVTGSDDDSVDDAFSDSVDEVASDSVIDDVEETGQNSFSDAATLPTDAQYGPVASGESLSLIAAELQRQFPDLSIYQIMKVLFEENQGSFINNNINGLISGTVLNIGDLDAIRAVDVEESKQFFSNQVGEWDPSVLVASDDSLKVGQDEYNFDSDTSLGSDTEFSSDDGSSDNFKIGASSDTETFVSQESGDTRGGEVIVLREQIAELQASLASSSLENQELTERISILEGQLADMNRLMNLNIEDAELASVEATLAEQNAEQALVDDSAPEILADSDELVLDDATDELAQVTDEFTDLDAEGALDELTDGVTDELADITESTDGALDELVDGTGELLDSGEETLDSAVEEVVESTTAVTPPPVAATESLVDKVKSAVVDSGLWKILAGVGVLLLGGLAAIFVRRRRADQEFEISMLSIESNSQSIDDGIATASASASMSASVTHSVAKGESEAEGDKETSFLTVYSDSDAVVQADEVDPIAEADVYIAYGRDEQAEEVLLDGVTSHPERLLGLYHKNKNSEGFERVAEELYSQRDSLNTEIWQDICRMGKEVVPGNPLFELSAEDLVAAEQVVAPDESTPEEAEAVAVDDLVDAGDLADEGDVDIDAPSEMVGEALDASTDDAIELVNFDDGRSEISELDELEIDALDSELTIDVAVDDDGGDADVLEIDSMDLTEGAGDDDALEFTAGASNSDASLDGDVEEEGDSVSEITISEVQEVSGLEIDADYDEARTQYELAKVFADLGDEEGARKILDELVANSENSADVIKDAQDLLDSFA